MTVNYSVTGRGDLDALFMPYTSGAQYGASGYIVSGYGDIGYRYQLIGGGTPIAATGFKIGGTDFASLFRGIGDSLTTIALADYDATTYHTGGTALCQYSVRNDGDVGATNGTNTVGVVGAWIAPKSGMGNYSVYATLVAGSPTGTFGSWLNLGTTRVWQLSRATIGSNVATIDFQIRLDSSGVVQDTARVTLYAERF